jgi:hypothetical protein
VPLIVRIGAIRDRPSTGFVRARRCPAPDAPTTVQAAAESGGVEPTGKPAGAAG